MDRVTSQDEISPSRSLSLSPAPSQQQRRERESQQRERETDRERDTERDDSLTAHTLRFFRDVFSLPTQREAMETVCAEMRAQKTLSIAGRKRLNDKTKAFRALCVSLSLSLEQSNAVFELLKAYQEEIDQLSKRAKLCESAYFAQYKVLCDAPDPVECIEGLMREKENSSASSLEVQRLQRELSQYETEFQTLRNQEVSLRRVEDELHTLRTEREADLERELSLRVHALRRESEREIADHAELVKAAEKRLSLCQAELLQTQQALDQAESRQFRASAASDAKVSALSQENSQLAESLLLAQSELALLRNTLTTQHTADMPHTTHTHNGSSPHNTHTLTHTDRERDALELVVAQVRAELQSTQDALHTERVKSENALRERERELVRERDERERLRGELQSRPQREEVAALRERLRTVCVAFRCENDDLDENTRPAGVGEALGPESVLSDTLQLERMLARKVSSLDTELAAVRRALSESSAAESAAQSALSQCQRDCAAKTTFVAKLESDLESRNQTLEKLVQQMHSQQALSPALAAKQQQDALTEDLSQMLGVVSHTQHTAEATEKPTAATVEANAQMVNVLQSQRDRYKEKLAQSEAMAQRLQEQVESLQRTQSQLQSENVSLYAKIKFLQSYSTTNNANNTRTNNYNNNRRPYMVEEGRQSEDFVEEKYRSLYEQQMNPFAEFSLHEKQRKLSELSVADRIVLNTALAVVSNHTGRSVLMVYLGAMHLLVFFTIYYVAHNVHHGCDPSLDRMHGHAA